MKFSKIKEALPAKKHLPPVVVFALLLTLCALVVTGALAATSGNVNAPPTVEKTVDNGGPRILDAGDELHVSISVRSGNSATTLRTLTDTVPPNFAAKDLPGTCFIEGEISPATISCNLGGMPLSGNITINYTLVAVSKSRRSTFDSAELDYEINGISGTSVSNEVEGEYAIGSPQLDIAAIRVSVDGATVPAGDAAVHVLPGSRINISFSLANSGSVRTPSGVFVNLTLPIGRGWTQLTPAGEVNSQALDGGASFPVTFGIGAPELKSGFIMDDGKESILVSFGFSGSGIKSTAFNFSKTTPRLEVEREETIEWKVENDGKGSIPSAYPILHVRHVIRNAGSASATGIVFEHDLPSSPAVEVENITLPAKGLELAPGESVTFEYYGLIPKGVKKIVTLVVPKTTVSFKDALGNDYTDRKVTIGKKQVKTTPTIWIRVFNATSIAYPLVPVAAVVVFALCIVGLWKTVSAAGRKNWYLALACTALGAIALLIAVSALKVAVFGFS